MVLDPGSEIRKKPFPDPGSRGQKGTGSRIRIRNTAKKGNYCNMIQCSGSVPYDFGSTGSGSVLQLFERISFHQQAKELAKRLISAGFFL